jgi:Zn ribbon nucleic-acid-binding protein
MLKKNSDRVFYGIGKQATDLTESINIVADYALCPDCGTKLRYDYLRYHHIGHAVCPNCGFHSQDAKYLVTEINAENKTLTLSVDGQESTYPIINPILFNIYNQLTVTTTLLELGIPQAKVQEIVAKIQVPDSRLNKLEVKGVSVTQAMSKGQSCISSCRTFDFVSSQPGKKSVVLAMDDYYDRKKSVEYIGWDVFHISVYDQLTIRGYTNSYARRYAVEQGAVEMMLFSINPAYDMQPGSYDIETLSSAADA